MTASRSMTDVAYELLTQHKKSVDFKELWNEVLSILGYDENLAKKKLVQFYNDMMLDKRFASLEGNKWDLKSRRKFEEIHVDTSAIIIEDDEFLDEDVTFSEEEKSKEEEF
ncbi:MAG: DNA-directed RNA polymerase subunit delta [Erysipelotrichaceae bacterium]